MGSLLDSQNIHVIFHFPGRRGLETASVLRAELVAMVSSFSSALPAPALGKVKNPRPDICDTTICHHFLRFCVCEHESPSDMIMGP